MNDEAMVVASIHAGAELGVEVIAPFDLDSEVGPIRCIAFIAHFGGANGIVVAPVHSPEAIQLREATSGTDYYFSLLASTYEHYDRDLFVDTLNDWGWKGDPGQEPSWYTGEPWGTEDPT
jgi:hypothetical protein